MTQPRVLVVDDDVDILALLRELLEDAGYEVQEAVDGRSGLHALYTFQPDLVLLDVMMPEFDGWLTLERIRGLTNVPVMMLTARASDADKARGLKCGADDYVTKPFDIDDLLARVDVLARRSWDREEARDSYEDAHVGIDFAARSVTVDGDELTLTPLEFKLLAAFVRHPNQVLTHEELLGLVWRDSRRVSVEQVKLYVANLRRKLASAHHGREALLETVGGVGYRYRPAVASSAAG